MTVGEMIKLAELLIAVGAKEEALIVLRYALKVSGILKHE